MLLGEILRVEARVDTSPFFNLVLKLHVGTVSKEGLMCDWEGACA